MFNDVGFTKSLHHSILLCQNRMNRNNVRSLKIKKPTRFGALNRLPMKGNLISAELNMNNSWSPNNLANLREVNLNVLLKNLPVGNNNLGNNKNRLNNKSRKNKTPNVPFPNLSPIAEIVSAQSTPKPKRNANNLFVNIPNTNT